MNNTTAISSHLSSAHSMTTHFCSSNCLEETSIKDKISLASVTDGKNHFNHIKLQVIQRRFFLFAAFAATAASQVLGS